MHLRDVSGSIPDKHYFCLQQEQYLTFSNHQRTEVRSIRVLSPAARHRQTHQHECQKISSIELHIFYPGGCQGHTFAGTIFCVEKSAARATDILAILNEPLLSLPR